MVGWLQCAGVFPGTLGTITPGDPFAYPGINITHRFCNSAEHLQSDLDMSQFDFMFVKPHDVPPLLCANV